MNFFSISSEAKGQTRMADRDDNKDMERWTELEDHDFRAVF